MCLLTVYLICVTRYLITINLLGIWPPGDGYTRGGAVFADDPPPPQREKITRLGGGGSSWSGGWRVRLWTVSNMPCAGAIWFPPVVHDWVNKGLCATGNIQIPRHLSKRVPMEGFLRV